MVYDQSEGDSQSMVQWQDDSRIAGAATQKKAGKSGQGVPHANGLRGTSI